MTPDLDSPQDLELPVQKKSFFRKIDWASFWTATLVSFLVYFLTLGPSVGLEDSGELAVAGDHLGVPHPPGYPIWTIISWVFARVFSFVTFRGQPTPAWSISLASAFFGALAAGCTSMLITRSASDMLASAHNSLRSASKKLDEILCYVGGVAGSLIFAFSPVMWSQSTIVEVYALGAFFLMLVMLLTYRWMRRPSDKLLWLTAFVFGLGLTNYQVLLLAAIPLVIIIFFRNLALFRDFVMLAVAFGLGALLLGAGSKPVIPGFLKHAPLTTKAPAAGHFEYVQVVKEILVPNQTLLWIAVSLFAAVFAGVAVFTVLRRKGSIQESSVYPNALFSVLSLLSVFFLLVAAGRPEAITEFENLENSALAQPVYYAKIAAFVMGAAALSAVASLRDRDWRDPWWYLPLGAAALLSVAAFLQTTSIQAPVLTDEISYYLLNGYSGTPFKFTLFSLEVCVPLFFLLGFSFFFGKAVCFALPVAAVEFTIFLLLRNGTMLGLTHPGTWWFWSAGIFNFVMLFLASFALPNGFSAAMTFLAGEIGVSFYAYMPIVSDLRNPPMNWGYPRTWEGFKHAISRGQYEKISPTDIFTPRFIQQIGDFFFDLRKQFTLLIVPFGILPFAAWRAGGDSAPRARKDLGLAAFAFVAAAALVWGADNWLGIEQFGLWFNCAAVVLLAVGVALAFLAGFQALEIALFFVAMAIVFVILGRFPQIEEAFDVSRIDILSIVGLAILCCIGLATMGFRQLSDSVSRAVKERDVSLQVTTYAVIAGVALFTVLLLGQTFAACLIGMTKLAPAGAKILAYLFSILITGTLFSVLRMVTARNVVRNSLDDISKQWLLGSVINFLVMSVLLIVLANPKGDLQDTFIQKVKFISSHGLFALWLGYGFIFAVMTVNSLARRFLAKKDECAESERPRGGAVAVLTCIAMAFAFVTPLIPVHENYFNKRLVFELGSAEQNGHDYGWQFGNYQLRGADAITEELEPDEEPLPNPSYPPEMGPGAVFYGGTDPGRFVPTYMIYSADVRPDVFLITQNALADNTFMATTRALYADDLWIPTPKESADAFQIYVQEVREGKRPKNADLEISGGRVQVTGALGVMEINGILAKMIFERNKDRHKFYVEESYVIPWMYPYLTPHGLIMHINNDPVQISRRNTEDDMDFWDWYVRRLTHDDRFRRDLVAQKSFSKLRSAIAGLYNSRGFIRESESAYSEARVLYPVSPEANFRMVQDIYLRQGRTREAALTVEEYCRQDYNNERGPQFLTYINMLEKNQEIISKYRSSYGDSPEPPITNALVAAKAYLEIGDAFNATTLLKKISSSPSQTVNTGCRTAVLLQEAGAYQESAALFKLIIGHPYVKSDPEALLSAFQAFSVVGDVENMRKSVNSYLRLKPMDWEMWARRAVLNIMAGDEKSAVQDITNAQRIDPDGFSAFVEKQPALLQFIRQYNERNARLLKDRAY